MVTLTSAENALKTVYLGVVTNQLNVNANPLLSKIKQTTSDVWGKEVRKLAPFGLNGGVGAGTEEGALPSAAANNYVQFVSELKNLYGTIELSDKAIRASSNNAGSFVNLLNDEMEGLIKASSFNFGRMLYGDGSGVIATVTAYSTETKLITVDSVRNLMEGMTVDTYTDADAKVVGKTARINFIDRANKQIKLSVDPDAATDADYYFTVQNSKGLELTGLGKIFATGGSLYGVTRSEHSWMTPYMKASVGAIGDSVIQTAIDYLEEVSGSNVDFIATSQKVKRGYQQYLATFRRNIDIMELAGGFKAISYNGIPVISDRFVEEDAMYLLDTSEFALHQLCDWKWLEGEDGRIIKQMPGYATYNATLVKYADLICNKPSGQAKLSGLDGTSEE
ncbi:MAG: phage major capsid protein [Clostridia bacterium]|nr:phage major capsid protein [Clostridia bacterium]